MRKRIVGPTPIHDRSTHPERWLDLEQIATVEVTSENPAFPIESVFDASKGPGWRASGKGEQRMRITFDQPIFLKRLRLRFVEPDMERTHEFSVSYSTEAGGPPKEILRQQWNFSPAGSTSEVEDLQLDLPNVSALELTIKPDLGHGNALATLAELRIARGP